jgi:hypothetical protein
VRNSGTNSISGGRRNYVGHQTLENSLKTLIKSNQRFCYHHKPVFTLQLDHNNRLFAVVMEIRLVVVTYYKHARRSYMNLFSVPKRAYHTKRNYGVMQFSCFLFLRVQTLFCREAGFLRVGPYCLHLQYTSDARQFIFICGHDNFVCWKSLLLETLKKNTSQLICIEILRSASLPSALKCNIDV